MPYISSNGGTGYTKSQKAANTVEQKPPKAVEAVEEARKAMNKKPAFVAVGVSNKNDEEERIYSEKFSGSFTERQLNYLNNYYDRLVAENGIIEANDLDYAKKAAKASLHVDEVQEKFAKGEATITDVKDALAIFDTLNKSANFAACKKKQKERLNASDVSLCEAILAMMQQGRYADRQIKWPKDSVDEVVDLFMHIQRAMNPNEDAEALEGNKR